MLFEVINFVAVCNSSDEKLMHLGSNLALSILKIKCLFLDIDLGSIFHVFCA